MAAPNISAIAWEAWTLKTGGDTSAEPTLRDVEMITTRMVAKVAREDYWKQLEDENDKNPNGDYMVPYLAQTLVDHGTNEKKVEMPARLMQFFNDRGLLVTFGDPAEEIVLKPKHLLIGKRTGADKFGANYYCYRLGQTLYITSADCDEDERPEMDEVDLYFPVANGNTAPEAIQALVFLEVMKALSGNVIPNDNADQRLAR